MFINLKIGSSRLSQGGIGKLKKLRSSVHKRCIRTIGFIFLFCFAFSSITEAVRSPAPRQASRHVSGAQKNVARSPVRKKREEVSSRTRSQRVSAVRNRSQRTSVTRSRSQRVSAVRSRSQRASTVRSRSQRVSAVRSRSQQPSARSVHVQPVNKRHIQHHAPIVPIKAPAPISPPPTYFSQLKPLTQKNAQLMGLTTLNGAGQTVAVIEQSGTWKSLPDAINSPHSPLFPEQRENYKNNFLNAIGGPGLHPEEQNAWIRSIDKNRYHGAVVASIVLDLAPKAKVLPISTYDAPESPEYYGVEDAVMDLVPRDDVRIINISAGHIDFTVKSKLERDANGALKFVYKTKYTSKLIDSFRAAVQAGKVIVLAAGNEGYDIQPPQFKQLNRDSKEPRSQIMGHLMKHLDPETRESVVLAGALDPNTGNITNYSNKPGHWAEAQDRFLFATGRHALSYNNDIRHGTSFAAPPICAAIANVCSKTGVTPKMAVQALMKTADERPEKHIYGRGVIRVDKAEEWLKQGGPL